MNATMKKASKNKSIYKQNTSHIKRQIKEMSFQSTFENTDKITLFNV